jgi:hypothetical protein
LRKTRRRFWNGTKIVDLNEFVWPGRTSENRINVIHIFLRQRRIKICLFVRFINEKYLWLYDSILFHQKHFHYFIHFNIFYREKIRTIKL